MGRRTRGRGGNRERVRFAVRERGIGTTPALRTTTTSAHQSGGVCVGRPGGPQRGMDEAGSVRLRHGREVVRGVGWLRWALAWAVLAVRRGAWTRRGLCGSGTGGGRAECRLASVGVALAVSRFSTRRAATERSHSRPEPTAAKKDLDPSRFRNPGPPWPQPRGSATRVPQTRNLPGGRSRFVQVGSGRAEPTGSNPWVRGVALRA